MYDKKKANERSKRNKARMKAEIKRLLGNKCAICGGQSKLIFHHRDYDTNSGKPSFKAYRAGKLVLLCTKCRHILNHLSRLRNLGQLDKALEILNNKTIYNRALSTAERARLIYLRGI